MIQERVFAHVFGVLTPGILAMLYSQSVPLNCAVLQHNFVRPQNRPWKAYRYPSRARVTRQRLAGNALLLHVRSEWNAKCLDATYFARARQRLLSFRKFKSRACEE